MEGGTRCEPTSSSELSDRSAHTFLPWTDVLRRLLYFLHPVELFRFAVCSRACRSACLVEELWVPHLQRLLFPTQVEACPQPRSRVQRIVQEHMHLLRMLRSANYDCRAALDDLHKIRELYAVHKLAHVISAAVESTECLWDTQKSVDHLCLSEDALVLLSDLSAQRRALHLAAALQALRLRGDWLKLLTRPREHWRIEDGLILLARCASPFLEPACVRASLSEIVISVWRTLGVDSEYEGDMSTLREQTSRIERRRVIEAIFFVMYTEWGFSGNTTDYFALENSCIDSVLKSREGLPLTLCAIFAIVARDAGLEGVSMLALPRHFMLSCQLGDDPRPEICITLQAAIFIDCFRGELMTFETVVQNHHPSLEGAIFRDCGELALWTRALRNVCQAHVNGLPISGYTLHGAIVQLMQLAPKNTARTLYNFASTLDLLDSKTLSEVREALPHYPFEPLRLPLSASYHVPQVRPEHMKYHVGQFLRWRPPRELIGNVLTVVVVGWNLHALGTNYSVLLPERHDLETMHQLSSAAARESELAEYLGGEDEESFRCLRKDVGMYFTRQLRCDLMRLTRWLAAIYPEDDKLVMQKIHGIELWEID